MQNLKNVFFNLVATYVLLFIGSAAYTLLKDFVEHFRTHPSEQ